ncbi:MAG: hypothetical protein RLZZ226_471 [Pseudomonadota bacterium]
MAGTTYFANVNPELLDWLPLDAGTLVEIGCGTGSLGVAYRARNPASRYGGVELHPEAADAARPVLDWVVTGDIEQPAVVERLAAALSGQPADVLVFGDVLEHLHDPWQCLARLRQQVRPGGTCVACIPNVAHWSLLLQQLQGRWDYADQGLLDRTHLRFFTLETAIELFRGAGWTVLDAKPRIIQPDKTRQAVELFTSLADRLGTPPERIRQNLSALQWVIRAVNGPVPTRLHVAGFGLRKQAGVTEARIDHPLRALASLPHSRVIHSEQGISLPTDWAAGVLILQRQFLIHPPFIQSLQKLIDKGWVIIQDMDDDPHHWREFVESDFYAYRAVHAVTVSTEPLAAMIRAWNPEVRLFANAIHQLPLIPATVPKQGGRIRIFFGALNREADWRPLQTVWQHLADQRGDAIEFVVVHDQAFFAALPSGCAKVFHPTLPQPDYMKVLASCDLALLPLRDTPFNRMKSDLKFIECCAAGVVPVCSSLIYADRPEHLDIGWFADTAADWLTALLAATADPAALAGRRALGLDYVKTRRMQAGQVRERAAYYQALIADRTRLEQARQARLAAIPARFNPLQSTISQ